MLHRVDIWMSEFWKLFPLACFAGSGEMWDDLLCVFWGWFKCLLALRGKSLASLPGPAEDLNLGYQAPVLHYPLEEPCPCGAHSWKICPKSVNARSYFAWISSAEMASGNGDVFRGTKATSVNSGRKSTLSSLLGAHILFFLWKYCRSECTLVTKYTENIYLEIVHFIVCIEYLDQLYLLAR